MSKEKQHTLPPRGLHLCLVMVEPKTSRNVGAVARAMSNFGYSDLRLVAPRNFNRDDALVTACQAGEIIRSARHYVDIAEAIEDCVDVVGFSAAYGKNRTQHVTLNQYVSELQDKPPTQPIALLFGPEDTGLRNEHVAYCRALVRIPSAQSNASFNVAQAALLALYEVSSVERPAAEPDDLDSAAAWKEYLFLEQQLLHVMKTTGFVRKSTSDEAIRVLQTVFKRTAMNKREMAMLHGLFRKIQKAIASSEDIV